MAKYLRLREKLRPYVRSLFKEASAKGSPIMRALFYEFPYDKRCWEVEDEYMFGSKYLVAPVMHKGAIDRRAYLPAGARWSRFDDGEMGENGETVEGGREVHVECDLEVMPVWERVED